MFGYDLEKASCSIIPDTSKKTHGIFVVFPHPFGSNPYDEIPVWWCWWKCFL